MKKEKAVKIEDAIIEKALSRTDAINRCISLGEQFI